jgi:hypothetical protein
MATRTKNVGRARRRGIGCTSSYVHDPTANTTRVECKQDCTKRYTKVGQACQEVTPVCMYVTRVKFVAGAFVEQAKPECVCVLPSAGDACTYKVKTKPDDTKTITQAGCEGVCRLYYDDKNCSVPTKLQCTMVIDHKDAQKIKCACIITG